MFGRLRENRIWPCLAAACVLCAWGSLAHAQEVPDLRLDTDMDDGTVEPPPPPPVATVASSIPSSEEELLARKPRKKKLEDPFAPLGVRSGGVIFYPSLEVGGVATSNVGRTNSNAKADMGLRLRPALKVETDWSRHAFKASASADMVRYLDNDSYSTHAGQADMSLRLDVRRTTHADFDARYQLTSTGASDSQVPDTATGARLDQSFGAGASITHDLGGLEARLRAGFTRNTYGDVKLAGGGVETNGDRDYIEPSLSLRGTLKTGASLQPFAEAAYEPRFHDRRLDRNGIARDSQGLRLTAGITLDDALWSGEVAGNLVMRNYKDPALDSVWAPGLSAALTWRPTELTRVNFNAAVSVGETSTPGESATRSWTGGIELTQALRENVDGILGTSIQVDDTSTGNDITTTGRAGVEWNLNPVLAWNAFYEGTWFNGSAANSDYTDHRLIASIILRR